MRQLRTARIWRKVAAVVAFGALALLAGGCPDETSPLGGADTGALADAGPIAGPDSLTADTTKDDVKTPGDDVFTPPGDTVGQPDKPAGSEVLVDEAGIKGRVEGSSLVLTIPVSPVKPVHTGGELVVTLRKVDEGEIGSKKTAAYDMPDGKATDVEATLALPAGLDSQVALSEWVVRVQSADDPTLRVTKSLLYVLPPYELALEGPKSLLSGRDAAYRIRATDPISHGPLEGVPVRLTLTDEDGKPQVMDAVTELTGDAIFQVKVDDAGDYDVMAEGWSQGTAAQVIDTIEVTESPRKILLTTDKPIYQPGQQIHLRALALEKPGLAPAAGEPVVFEVEDGKGNKILKKEIAADEYGIAATTFQLGNILNMGTFKIRALMGELKTEKTVEVSVYALPKFKVDVNVDQPWYLPGATIAGTLDTGYFFGKPVAGGTVDITASTLDVGETVFQQVTGKTDADGKFDFQVEIPTVLVGLPLEQGKAIVQLAFVVTDTAEQVVEKSVAVVVSAQPIAVTAVPEASDIVPGTDNVLQVFVADPLGAPIADAAIEVTAEGVEGTVKATTDAFGYAAVVLSVTGDPGEGATTVKAKAPTGEEATETYSFGKQSGIDHVLVRTDKAIYDAGETANITMLTTGPSMHVYVDWLNEGQVVDMRTVEAKDGMASFDMDLDASLLGDNRIEAYIVDKQGNIVRASRSIFVRDAKALSVALSTDKPIYKPGEPAELTFSVTKEDGAPTVAALGVQIVDQAVFALIDAKPGLLKTYFELNDLLSQPQYEIHGATFDVAQLVFEDASSEDVDTAGAAQNKAQAAFAALPMGGVTGIHRSSWADIPSGVKTLLTPYYDKEREELISLLSVIVQKASDELAAEGCEAMNYYCQDLQMSYVQALVERTADLVTAYDFWGNAYALSSVEWDGIVTVTSSGPDETADNADDWKTTLQWDELGLPDYFRWVAEPGIDNDGEFAGGGGGGGEPPPSPTEGGDEEAEGPAVRKDFPETLYVNPALITGPDGLATVSLDMADSITEWRVTSLAHTADGRLGSGVSGITVFQDFFVDINFPATLTRGDEIAFPIALYNYLDTPQSVSVTLEPADFYTALGQTQLDIDLQPGEVAVAKFPVRVDKVGVHALTVTGKGSELSDAVQRKVKVVSDGKAFVTAKSGALEAGSVSYDAEIPPESIKGSEVLYVNLYPAYMTQLVEGLDSMLKQPFG